MQRGPSFSTRGAHCNLTLAACWINNITRRNTLQSLQMGERPRRSCWGLSFHPEVNILSISTDTNGTRATPSQVVPKMAFGSHCLLSSHVNIHTIPQEISSYRHWSQKQKLGDIRLSKEQLDWTVILEHLFCPGKSCFQSGEINGIFYFLSWGTGGRGREGTLQLTVQPFIPSDQFSWV